MQTEKLNTTIETVEVQSRLFTITTFEATMRVMCNCCGSQASEKKSNLVHRGWMFCRGAEFCPECNF